MEWFFTEEDRSALKKREQILTCVFRALVIAVATVFVILCLLITTENAKTMHWVLIAVTTLLGWACIAVWQLGIKEAKTQLGHLEMLRNGEKDFREGRVAMTRDSVQIPKSIRIRKVLLDNGGEEPARLNLDEAWVSRMPPDGSRVRLAVTHSYIAGAEILEEAPGKRPERGASAGLRKAGKLIPLLGIWAIASVIVCSFVFYQVTDTDPAHKITIWVDGEVREEARLAALLEKELPDPVRMVQIHPFTYAMFGSAALKAADLFIVPDSDRDQFSDWFVPGEEGVPVHDPETGLSAAGTWIQYRPEETYRMYLGADSVHLEDGLAKRAAGLLAALEEEQEEIK